MTREEALGIVREASQRRYPDSLVDAFVKLGVLKLDEEPNRFGSTLGNRIATARRLTGITQLALAATLGVSPQAVSGWERDEAMPETTKLVSLADELGISLDSLLRTSETGRLKSGISPAHANSSSIFRTGEA